MIGVEYSNPYTCIFKYVGCDCSIVAIFLVSALPIPNRVYIDRRTKMAKPIPPLALIWAGEHSSTQQSLPRVKSPLLADWVLHKQPAWGSHLVSSNL